jgi:hypothetical protein
MTMAKPVHNIEPRQAAAERERAAEATRARLQQEAQDVCAFMASEVSRRVLFGLLDRADLLGGRSIFNTNAMQMAHDEGRRVVLSRLVEMARTHCPDLWATMLTENVK